MLRSDLIYEDILGTNFPTRGCINGLKSPSQLLHIVMDGSLSVFKWLVFLIGPLYLIGVLFHNDPRANNIKTHV